MVRYIKTLTFTPKCQIPSAFYETTMNVSLFVLSVCLSVCLYVSFFWKLAEFFSKCSNSVDSFFFTKLYEFYNKIDFFAFLPYLFRNVVILIQIVKNAKFPNGKENNFQVWFLTREAFLNLNISLPIFLNQIESEFQTSPVH